MTTVARRITRGDWNAQHLYFTTASLTADETRLLVLGDRDRPARGPYDPDAAVNVFVVDVESGAAERLTDSDGGVAESYVYFGGHQDRGLAPGTVAFSPAAGTVLYVQDRAVRRVSVDGGEAAVVAELPPDTVPGYGALSGDGDRYVVPVIDRSAFADLHAIDATVRRLGLVGHVLVFDTSTGDLLDDLAVPGGWVTHAQFRPGDAGAILFNHEWAEGSGHRRLWLSDADGTRPLRQRDRGETDGPIDGADDVEHEIWTPDGRAVVYHGVYRAPGRMAGRSFVGRVSVPDGIVTELAFPPGFASYGHISALDDHTLVTDGIAEPTDAFDATGRASRRTSDGESRRLDGESRRLDGADAPGEDAGGRWIALIDVDWSARRLAWRPIVEHGSSWSSQDAHPHPIFDRAGRSVIFTTDVDGHRAVASVTPSEA
jgi:oligogalacturonide lyase